MRLQLFFSCAAQVVFSSAWALCSLETSNKGKRAGALLGSTSPGGQAINRFQGAEHLKKESKFERLKNGFAQFSLGHHAIDRGAKIALSDILPQVQKAAPPACGAVKR